MFQHTAIKNCSERCLTAVSPIRYLRMHHTGDDKNLYEYLRKSYQCTPVLLAQALLSFFVHFSLYLLQFHDIGSAVPKHVADTI
jgi:hypothetical protein